MTKHPNQRIAVILYVIYNLIIFGTWWSVGANYNTMIEADNMASAVLLPLALGFIFLAGTLTVFGWWKPVLRDSERAAPAWALWPFLIAAVAFIGITAAATNWSNLGSTHLLVMIGCGLFVGFNEEALTRGILVLGFRDGGKSEAWVWFASSLLFGLLHLPNALFGLPLGDAFVQVGFAFVMGGGFYVLRRLSGTILVPMVVHGLWDFVSFTMINSGAEVPAIKGTVQFASYGLAILCVAILLWTMRGRHANQGA